MFQIPTNQPRAMRYPTGDLAILSAESYDDGRRHLASRKTEKTVAEVVVAPDTLNGPARKRRKASSPDVAGEEEEKKRSRGRPRLEPKDETAQDVSHFLCATSCSTFTVASPTVFIPDSIGCPLRLDI